MVQKELLKYYLRYVVLFWFIKLVILLVGGKNITEMEFSVNVSLIFIYILIIYRDINNREHLQFVQSLPISRDVCIRTICISGVIMVMGANLLYQLVVILNKKTVYKDLIIGNYRERFMFFCCYTMFGIMMLLIELWFVLHGLKILRIAGILFVGRCMLYSISFYAEEFYMLLFSGNAPMYSIGEKWTLVTVPLKKLEEEIADMGYRHEVDTSVGKIWFYFILFVLVMLIVSFAFYKLDKNLFNNMNNESGHIYKFGKATVYLSFFLICSCIFTEIVFSYRMSARNHNAEYECVYHDESTKGNMYIYEGYYLECRVTEITSQPDINNIIKYLMLDGLKMAVIVGITGTMYIWLNDRIFFDRKGGIKCLHILNTKLKA